MRGSWGDTVTAHGVVRGSGSSHEIEEYWTGIVKGTILMKFGRRGNPHMHFFRLSDDHTALQWQSKNGRIRRVPLSSVQKVLRGQNTQVFLRSRNPQTRSMNDLSFSLTYKHRSEERTLDLVCKDAEEFNLWYNGLKLINEQMKTQAAVPVPTGGGTVVGVPTAMQGVPKHTPPGDCYIWGGTTGQPAKNGNDSGAPPGEQISVTLPQLVPSAQKLDIVQVASGPQHFSAVTRSGHLYTWGSGSSGRLGLGTLQHVSTPTTVYGLTDMAGVQFVSCGDCNTASILKDGSLFTWGGGLSGQLGHDNVATQYLPRRVERGLYGVKVVEVSCGPYHTAAIAEEGSLYTWGDGLCGKLGHGDWESSLIPKPVESLVMEGRVKGVSCGWWHTAAVLDLGSSHNNVKSGLYTWGAEFTWEGDHNKGCLGTGTTEGTSEPMRVMGDLTTKNVVQVACGLNLTVALTKDGLVYQMGVTGAEDTHVAWEGAREPTRVQGLLKGFSADRVACGRRHVCVVATPISGGRPDEDRRSTYLFSWGQGKNGQLGIGDKKDHSSPRLVEALRQRRILDVCCGGDYTLAVCRYDPRVAAATFVWNPEPPSTIVTPTNNQNLQRRSVNVNTSNGSAFASVGFASMFTNQIKSSISGRGRSDRSSAGSESSMASRDPTKQKAQYMGVKKANVVRVSNSHVKLARQKLNQAQLLELSGRPSVTSPSPPPVDDEASIDGEETSTLGGGEGGGGSMVTPRRTTAPPELRGPGGEDLNHHRMHHLSADTAFQDIQYPEGGVENVFDSAPMYEDNRSVDSLELQTRDYDGESIASGVLSEPTPSGRDMVDRYRDVDASSTEGSFGTTEGPLTRTHDSEDDEDCRSRSHTRSSSQVDMLQAEEEPVPMPYPGPSSLRGQEDEVRRQEPEGPSFQPSLPLPPSGPSWPVRNQQLRSTARFRSRLKVLQQVVSLSETWNSPNVPTATQSLPAASTSPSASMSRLPKLWEEESIREGKSDDMGEGAKPGAKEVRFEDKAQESTGRAAANAVPSLMVHVLEQGRSGGTASTSNNGSGTHRMLQLPGHSARERPENPTKSQLDRKSAASASAPLSLATARNELMNRAAEYEHWRQRLQIYMKSLQTIQTKLNTVAEQQNRDAGDLGVEIEKVQDMMKNMPSVSNSTLNPPGDRTASGSPPLDKDSRLMKEAAGHVQKLVELMDRSEFFVDDDKEDLYEEDADKVDRMLGDRKQLKDLLMAVSEHVEALRQAFRIKQTPVPAPVPLSIPTSPARMPEPPAQNEIEDEVEEEEEEEAQQEPSEPVKAAGPTHKRVKSLDLGQPGGGAGASQGPVMHMWMDHVDKGVSVIFQTAENVTKIKKIRFSKRMFTAERAQQWWQENQSRLVRKYNLIPGSTMGDQNPMGQSGSYSQEGGPARRAPAGVSGSLAGSVNLDEKEKGEENGGGRATPSGSVPSSPGSTLPENSTEHGRLTDTNGGPGDWSAGAGRDDETFEQRLARLKRAEQE